MSLKSLPVNERPRERLMQKGEDKLSNSELLAIILGSGTKGKSVLHLSEELLHAFGGLKKILDASVEELMDVKGVGKVKAIQLKAAFALALRCVHENSSAKQLIEHPRDAYAMLKDLFFEKKQEMLAVLLKDIKGHAFHREIITMGTLSEVMIHPREVFHTAVRHKAHSLIIAHNHPSGDPTPSSADIRLTNLLLHSSKVMGINLDDHIIIGANQYVSLSEVGIIR